jgi:hypothetical protein
MRRRRAGESTLVARIGACRGAAVRAGLPGQQFNTMKILKHWKVILAVILVFTAGGVVGSVLTTIHFKRGLEHGLKPENWTREAMKFLDRKLKLTAEQRPRIQAVLDDTALQFKRSFGQAIAESGTNLVVSWRRTDRELTPEQQTIFRRENQKFREKLKKDFNMDLPPQ